jgi:hypothetical protein
MTSNGALRQVALFAAFMMIFTRSEPAATGSGCPATPEFMNPSPDAPADVCIPEGFTDVPIDFFDNYSWRAFIAMIWPAAPLRRGVPDRTLVPGAPVPLVFETYKSLWEVFHDDGSAPQANFNAMDTAVHNACKVAPKFGDLILASSSGVGDIGQAGVGELVGPLVAQNGKYVRYLTLYNQIAYDFIVRNKLYLRSTIPAIPSPRPEAPMLQFPDGSIAIKAAWIEMAGMPDDLRNRYYMREAIVRDPGNGKCSRVTVGLAAMHVVQKTPSRPQWIWSSFEQLDNVPPAQFGANGKFGFHDGNLTSAMPEENPLALKPLALQPIKPFNVERAVVSPIHPRTANTNGRYERLISYSVWKNYQLVTTQWPRLDGDQAKPVRVTLNGDILNSFPGKDATSAFANVVIETFDQSRPQLGCMSCHNRARMQTDFMWSVMDHAWPPAISAAAQTVR